MKEANTRTESRMSKASRLNIGPVPLPVYTVLAAIIILTAYLEQLPVSMIGGFSVILSLGWLLGTIGGNIPGLKHFGGPAILSLLVPSIMVFFNLFNPNVLEATDMLMKQANFLYFYIACLVCGSILGMHRKILVQGLMRMIVPMLCGMILAMIVGTTIGTLLGLGFKHTMFYIVTPVLAGGIGEGILPLSLGYSAITGIPSEQLVGQLIPATIIGNFFAIMSAAFLSRVGERKKDKCGNGQLVKMNADDMSDAMVEDKSPIDVKLMGAGVLIASTLFITGGLLQHLTGFPGPVLMILVAALVKYLSLLPANMEKGSKQLYKFISSNFTFPLMVGLGMLYIPLKDVVGMLSWQYFVVVISVVLTVVVTGYFVGGKMNMYPIEAAIITACQSGMGGTGDVAILSTANRMNLMPFAQVATRLGGAITVLTMTALLKFLF
ncbi:2-hydroxycarboxylate transporter family protein [Vagococcus intermedius]|uniref:2-hydroxycarboxylate transporter family protein n=1 Tax=Vagococcus intermedius TaxID=2991418 RepID=A0AAF0CUW8_9ENTE|nr:2-hydroxycarboxylate transporter family protein [Vagococcus intermedius]WEG73326.1 2-hydroxycarboxylate transporter family protein [Vagococcus intermedius]WEG75406.1 2-hydroxycarboxylate transporter family protein [Vagococcus intermedius]